MRAAHTPISARFAGSVLFAGLLATVLLYVYIECTNTMTRMCFLTGWVLFGTLMAECTRRFLLVRSGGDPRRWVGQQTALAVMIVVMFMMHVEFSVPNGWLDGVLTGLFIAILLTGAIGVLLWTQLRIGSIAATGADDESVHESALREIERRASEEYEGIGIEHGRDSEESLRRFFAARPGFVRRVFWTNDLSMTLRQLHALKAGTPDEANGAVDRLLALAIEKDRLDALRVGDRAVRRWLLVHVPCVACLLALGSMHGVLSHAHGVLAHVLLGK